MAIRYGLGNFINGAFHQGTVTLTSKNPSRNYEPVFSTSTDYDHLSLAVKAGKSALKSWAALSLNQRAEYLQTLKACFIKHEADFTEAINHEMGKISSEAAQEAKSLSARIDLSINHGANRVKTERHYDMRAETRYHQQGLLAVLGPFNYPAHLVNTHVIPSLLMGNTVIVKPSELCPWVGEIYAQCFLEAGLPAGVFNLVHGDGQIGRALAVNQDIDGVLFTGSYQTGRVLQELLLDQPHKILALELGGKNFALVMDDADLEQAVLEVIQGAFLTTGQRCTATSRVLVQESIFERFTKALVTITANLPAGMFGPLASKSALDKLMAGLERARHEGAQVLLESRTKEGGAFVTPSIYQVDSNHPITGFLGEELFGPHLCLESFMSLDQAIARIKQSPYGLSNSIFSADPHNHERMYKETKSGVLNINRSTNGALGTMPFGGVNKSGNQRPAGIDAVRYATYPVAITELAYGETSAGIELQKMAQAIIGEQIPLSIIKLRHEIEAIFELFGINSDLAANDRLIYTTASFNNLGSHAIDFFSGLTNIFGQNLSYDKTRLVFCLSKLNEPQILLAKLKDYLENFSSLCGLAIRKTLAPAMNIPHKLELPRSRSMLDRLYHGHLVPKDKKSLVADLYASRGAYLASIDDNPLVLFDAASQIATLGAGFMADTWQNAYDSGELDLSLTQNYDLAEDLADNSELAVDAKNAQLNFERFLHEKSQHRFLSIGYGAGGAEANEIAFDLCRQNGPGGTKIIAFEGSFHGRTIMALQATYNKEKRGPFMFKGFEASFVPFPKHNKPHQQPPIDVQVLSSLSQGQVPEPLNPDDLLVSELQSLHALKKELSLGNICCVIIEPLQCEGGDQYASHRFFNYLRALTRGLKIPLIFDEVQTGFHLGRTFFWHHMFELKNHRGEIEQPDCVTMGKKAQLGVCMSVWANPRSYSPHVVQLKRGLLHGQVLNTDLALSMESKAIKELNRLEEYFPNLVMNSRACGFAFAFDMPTAALANDLINQRFERGFMAYIAGEKTLRFRLNMTTSDQVIKQLFEKLFVALVDLRDQHQVIRINAPKKPETSPENSLTIIDFVELNIHNFDSYAQAIEACEEKTYEQGRRDSIASLRSWLEYEHSVGIAMHCLLDGQKILAGYSIGGPLEHSQVDGPSSDSQRGQNNTFYSANITLDHRVRALGLGTKLKHEQIRRLIALKNSSGQARYYFMTGRNRVDKAGAMTYINQQLGAYTLKVFDKQYGEDKAQALYYRLPLLKSHHQSKKIASTSPLINCQNSLQRVFSRTALSLEQALANNQLRTIAGSKLTLSNWATPNMVRYSELLRSVMPKPLNHAYFTSGRDEVVDKGLRSLRYHRLDADMVIGFSHQWLGNVSAAARSLSHSENQAQPFKFFDWPHISHPSLVGVEQSLSELKQVLAQYPPEKILAIVCELIGEKSGFSFDEYFLAELDKIRSSSKIPLVFVENSSAFGRSGQSLFLSESLKIKPNMLWWYTGGQLGHVFVDDHYFVDKPLTLISTWDGDDISIARSYHNLMKACSLDFSIIKHYGERIKKLAPHRYSGMGTWQGFSMENVQQREKVRKFLLEHKILSGRGFNNQLMICPSPDCLPEHYEAIIGALSKVIS